MRAWQRQIRDQIAVSGGDLFGRWWDGMNPTISGAEVREIDRTMAEKIILEYEWLGTMPAVTWHCYGIFFDGVCGGAVVYGPEYSENLGVWDRYGFTGRMILLSRGACVHWAHPHAASKLIRRSMALLPPRYEVVTATTDERAGEVGTIYQACNFVFAMMNTHSRSGAVVNGKRVGSRAVRQRMGKSDKSTILRIGGAVEREDQKGRYFAFRGDKRTQRRHRKAISHLIKPHPKRQSSGVNAADHAEARFDPALPLHQSARSSARSGQ